MKVSIGLRFSKASSTYEREAFVQKISAKEIASMSSDLEGTGIDLGCGTGFLQEFLPDKDIIGIDISKKMIQIYKDKNEKALVGDIENLPFKREVFDFAISNFSLHWTDFEKSISEVHRVLKKDGTFIFNTPVKGSFKIVKEILGYETFLFLEEKKIKEIISNYFVLEKFFKKSYRMYFNSGIELLKHLKLTGTTFYQNGKSIGNKIKVYRKFETLNENIYLNFDVVFLKVRKKL